MKLRARSGPYGGFSINNMALTYERHPNNTLVLRIEDLNPSISVRNMLSRYGMFCLGLWCLRKALTGAHQQERRQAHQQR